MRIYFVAVVLLLSATEFIKGFVVCSGPYLGWEALLVDSPSLGPNIDSLAGFVVYIQCYRLLFNGVRFLLREVIGV